MPNLTLVTPPAAEVITLAEAKLFLRVDGTTEDALITDLIKAVRVSAEEYTRKSFITQTWKISFDDEVSDCVELLRGPVQSITHVKTYTRDNTATTISSALYALNAAKTLLMLDTDLYAYRVEITYSAGYGAAVDVPLALKQGMLHHIAALYETREAGSATLSNAQAFYALFREVKL